MGLVHRPTMSMSTRVQWGSQGQRMCTLCHSRHIKCVVICQMLQDVLDRHAQRHRILGWIDKVMACRNGYNSNSVLILVENDSLLHNESRMLLRVCCNCHTSSKREYVLRMKRTRTHNRFSSRSNNPNLRFRNSCVVQETQSSRLTQQIT